LRMKILDEHLAGIRKSAKEIDRDITVMEICGGHTNVIMKYGIRELLPPNIRLISGPGCPVCVTSQYDINCMIALANAGIAVATYGDMMRVPGTEGSLEDARAHGHVFEVYSTTEVMGLMRQYPDLVFFGVGFETTAPMSAFLLGHNVVVYSVHKLVPPVLKQLLRGDVKIDGFIDPGHVSTIIGAESYSGILKPQAISGFTPERVLRALRVLLRIIRDGKDEVINAYPEAVSTGGNRKAQESLRKHFRTIDAEWRGLGKIPGSGLEVKEAQMNAKLRYREIIEKVPQPKKTACRCGDILTGRMKPNDCPLYNNACTPDTPQGACMVSDEGSCAIYHQYGK